jgi:hypothetical protein
MKSKSPFRRIAWIALLVIAPGVAGPGVIVATLTALASLDGDHAHHVSIQRNVGHDDFVICHEPRDGADAFDVAVASADCADDHRLHTANIESLISRHHGSVLPDAALLALVAAPFTETIGRVHAVLPVSSRATQSARFYQRTVVLRL